MGLRVRLRLFREALPLCKATTYSVGRGLLAGGRGSRGTVCRVGPPFWRVFFFLTSTRVRPVALPRLQQDIAASKVKPSHEPQRHLRPVFAHFMPGFMVQLAERNRLWGATAPRPAPGGARRVRMLTARTCAMGAGRVVQVQLVSAVGSSRRLSLQRLEVADGGARA
eukprot:scaffold94864_cov69-Phaeocystis_antarctica.AAC.4